MSDVLKQAGETLVKRAEFSDSMESIKDYWQNLPDAAKTSILGGLAGSVLGAGFSDNPLTGAALGGLAGAGIPAGLSMLSSNLKLPGENKVRNPLEVAEDTASDLFLNHPATALMGAGGLAYAQARGLTPFNSDAIAKRMGADAPTAAHADNIVDLLGIAKKDTTQLGAVKGHMDQLLNRLEHGGAAAGKGRGVNAALADGLRAHLNSATDHQSMSAAMKTILDSMNANPTVSAHLSGAVGESGLTSGGKFRVSNQEYSSRLLDGTHGYQVDLPGMSSLRAHAGGTGFTSDVARDAVRAADRVKALMHHSGGRAAAAKGILGAGALLGGGLLADNIIQG